MRPPVFISYAAAELDAARWLRAELHSRGWMTHLAAEDLAAMPVDSEAFAQAQKEAIAGCSVMVALVSPLALASAQNAREWRSMDQALRGGRKRGLLPLWLSGPAPDAWPDCLRPYQAIDAREAGAREAVLMHLLGQLDLLLGRETGVFEIPRLDAPPPKDAGPRSPWPARGPALELLEGPGAPQTFQLESRPYVLGRHDEVDICIASAQLSRKHLSLEPADGDFAFRDLGSKNGVLVDGVRAEAAILRDGDVLRLGDVVLVYRVVR